MKFLTTVLLAIVLLCSIQAKKPTLAQQKRYDSLRSSDKWGSIGLKLAELSVQNGNPLGGLIDSMQEVINDLGKKVGVANENYQKRTEEHDSEVARINDLIDSANSDITELTSFIYDVLYVQVSSLETDIERYGKEIEASRQYITDETIRREKEHEEFLVLVEQSNFALEAIDEARQVFSQLDDGVQLELIQSNELINQTQKVKKHLQNLQQKSSNFGNSDVKLLIALGTMIQNQGFADQESVAKVLNLMDDISKKLTEKITLATDQEEIAQTDYVNEVQSVRNQIDQLTLFLQEAEQQLESTKQQIEDNLAFKAQREQDLVSFQEQLDIENQNYETYVQNYEDLIAQLEKEAQAVTQAIEFLQSSNIEGYIGDRLEQTSDNIIDTPHGEGITVEKDPFDFE